MITGVRRVALPIAAVIACSAATHAIASRVAQYGGGARARLAPAFARAGIAYPPRAVTLVGLKDERVFHLSLRVTYPNAFDRRQAAADRRTRLGGDIMIHGNAVSIGCLAMGDLVAEELFVLAADTGLANVAVILAPHDLRRRPAPADASLPPWAPSLYAQVASALARLPTRE